MNRNFRKEYAYPPSWALGISGTEAGVIFVFGDLKNYQKYCSLYFIPRKIKTPVEDVHIQHPGHQVFLGSEAMSYLFSTTSKKP